MPDLSDAGDAKALEEFQKKLKENESTEQLGDEIEIGAPVPGIEEPEDQPTDRQQRRQDRPGLMKALEEEREERRALEKRLAELEGRAAATPPQPPAPPVAPTGPDPADERLKSIAEELDANQRLYTAEYTAANGKLDSDREAYFRRRAQELGDERVAIQTERAVAKHMERRPQGDPNESALRAMYPEILDGKQNEMLAGGEYRKLLARGETAGLATQKKAIENVRKELGLDGRPPASAAERRRNTGGRTGSAAPASSKKTVANTKELRKLALAHYSGSRYRNLTDAQKIQKFANEYGDTLSE